MDTDKKNFRCPLDKWTRFGVLAESMRADGYDTDMTHLLNLFIDQAIQRGPQAVAESFGLPQQPVPGKPWRKPFPRPAEEDQGPGA